MEKLKQIALLSAALLCFITAGSAYAQVDVTIGYLEKKVPHPPILYNLE